MNSVRTCYGQTIEVGSQVAYAQLLPVDWSLVARTGVHELKTGIRVAKVVGIEQVNAGFAEADATVMLTLDDGRKINCEDVAVTDGNFRYAK